MTSLLGFFWFGAGPGSRKGRSCCGDESGTFIGSTKPGALNPLSNG